MVYNRSPTPPPIPELIVDDNAPGPTWFFGSNGGGARLPFGKFKGQCRKFLNVVTISPRCNQIVIAVTTELLLRATRFGRDQDYKRWT